MLTDLLGWCKRNSKNWDVKQTRKMLNEIDQIKKYLEQKLRGVA